MRLLATTLVGSHPMSGTGLSLGDDEEPYVVKTLAASAVVAAFIACGLGAYTVFIWQTDDPDPVHAQEAADTWSPPPIIASERAALEPALAALQTTCREFDAPCTPRPVRRIQAGIWRLSLDRTVGDPTCVIVDLAVFRVRDATEIPEGVEVLDGAC